MAAEWHEQAGASSRLSLGLAMHLIVGRVTRPWNGFLGFAKHCQMSLRHSNSKFADFVVLKNTFSLLFLIMKEIYT